MGKHNPSQDSPPRNPPPNSIKPVGAILSFFKPLDYLLILIGIVFCTLSILSATTRQDGTPLLIVSSPANEYIYPLDTDTTVQIPGLEGISTIQIQQGQAQYLDSPCANKTCVAASPIHRNGEWSACLPNGIFMRVENSTSDSTTDIDIMAF